MTTLGDLALASPHLPARPPVAARSIVTTLGFHGVVLGLALSIVSHAPQQAERTPVGRLADTIALPSLVFFPASLPNGGGGGGGGNRQSTPIRHAESIGHDAMTVRIAPPAEPVAPLRDPDNAAPLPESAPPVAGLVLDAQPMASGTIEQIGLPEGGVPYGTSQGPGSGGGVGSGVGTGIGSGEGPGFGPGSGGGTGGGVYRAGGSVSAPRVLTQVLPVYTTSALRLRIMGSVVLEAVVTKEGLASAFRIVRSLDAGLDEEAMKAVRQWRFAPGRLRNTPVDVQVVVVVDFAIR